MCRDTFPNAFRVSLVKPPPENVALTSNESPVPITEMQLTTNRLVTLSRYHDASSPAGPAQQKRPFLPHPMGAATANPPRRLPNGNPAPGC